MRMMSPDEVPRAKTIGILAGCAALLFIVGAWLIAGGDADYGMYSFPPLLIGIVLLFMALALLALRAINQRQTRRRPAHSPSARDRACDDAGVTAPLRFARIAPTIVQGVALWT